MICIFIISFSLAVCPATDNNMYNISVIERWIIDGLKNTLFFGKLNETEIRAIAEIGLVRHCRKKDLLFVEGDSAHGFYVVISGQLKLYKLSATGIEYIIHIISSGETFGEAAAFNLGHFPAFCSTLSKSVLFYIPVARFVELVKDSPSLALSIIASLSSRLREFNQTIADLTFADVTSRLARYLLENVKNNNTVKLTIRKNVLASRLGTASETLSRCIAELKRKRIIVETSANTIQIIDQDNLEKISSK